MTEFEKRLANAMGVVRMYQELVCVHKVSRMTFSEDWDDKGQLERKWYPGFFCKRCHSHWKDDEEPPRVVIARLE